MGGRDVEALGRGGRRRWGREGVVEGDVVERGCSAARNEVAKVS